jgi:starch phosphorylase
MKSSMTNLGPFFNTERMVKEYVKKFYLKAYEKRKFIMANEWEKAKAFTQWKELMFNSWKEVRFVNYSAESKESEIKVGSDFTISAEVSLGKLTPNDIDVQIYYGKKDDMEKPF